MTITDVLSAALARLNASPIPQGSHCFSVRPHGRGVGFEINGKGVRHCRAVGDQVVKALVAGVVLQLVDHRKAAVIQHADDQLFARQDGRINIRVHQHIRPVTGKDDGVCSGSRSDCAMRAPQPPAIS